jgi:hypothetical protein
MHATTEQLLSLRDGQPVEAGAAAHTAGCEQCRRELARLGRVRARLQALPQLDPPVGAWRVAAADAAEAPAAVSASRWQWVAGIAASFVLGMALVIGVGDREDAGPARGTTTDLIASTPAPASSVNGVTTGELLETSRQLEAALRALPAAPRMTRASTALTIAELQDRIVDIDMRLNDQRLDPAMERALWQQRVMLMDTLMQVRFAQLSDVR